MGRKTRDRLLESSASSSGKNEELSDPQKETRKNICVLPRVSFYRDVNRKDSTGRGGRTSSSSVPLTARETRKKLSVACDVPQKARIGSGRLTSSSSVPRTETREKVIVPPGGLLYCDVPRKARTGRVRLTSLLSVPRTHRTETREKVIVPPGGLLDCDVPRKARTGRVRPTSSSSVPRTPRTRCKETRKKLSVACDVPRKACTGSGRLTSSSSVPRTETREKVIVPPAGLLDCDVRRKVYTRRVRLTSSSSVPRTPRTPCTETRKKLSVACDVPRKACTGSGRLTSSSSVPRTETREKVIVPPGGLLDCDVPRKARVRLLKQEALDSAFTPLDANEEAYVTDALYGNSTVSVFHENSNIKITKEDLQRLLPGKWLNDEVINIYLALLKEREGREPDKFLKCHYFNTFFYKKLYNRGKQCDYNIVKKWDREKKIGYNFIDCDKIFVPIHQENHWCLVIIDMKAKKFQYFDSLGGKDLCVFSTLVGLIEAKASETSKVLDVRSWKREFVKDLPRQENESDCGMFMIKYADFHSRKLPLRFSQGDMLYFRKRVAKEILLKKVE